MPQDPSKQRREILIASIVLQTVTLTVPAGLGSLLLTVLPVIFYGTAGYLSDLKTNGSAFNWKSFLKTILPATLIGVYNAYSGSQTSDGTVALIWIGSYFYDKLVNSATSINKSSPATKPAVVKAA